VAGATGYAGRELIALLSRHPRARIARLMSSSGEGKKSIRLERAHPALRGKLAAVCEPLTLTGLDPAEVDVVFLATPHEAALEIVPTLLDRGLKVIDLSGAFRLKASDAYPRWYKFDHSAPEALAQAVYGLTELNAEAIRSAQLVSNPGCYATSVILALAPLLKAGWVDADAGIIADSKSGASGAGRAPSEKLHFPEVNENCRAYSPFTHRHVPEILQTLDLNEANFTFTPHLLPVTRGMLSTVYVRLREHRSLEETVALFQNFYSGAPLVRVYGDGGLPEIQSVAHTNYADLGFALDAPSRRLIVVSALDNLGKGAAGQAIQNMNLMFGYSQETGLE
jgi:N-acetyl-gamma-glutamyl-phosphate reductase